MNKIKDFLHKCFCLIGQSHRGTHLIGGFLVGLVFGCGAVVAVSAALEWKDCQWDRLNAHYGLDMRKWIWRDWDWVDFAMTCVGGLVGGMLHWVIVMGVMG